MTLLITSRFPFLWNIWPNSRTHSSWAGESSWAVTSECMTYRQKATLGIIIISSRERLGDDDWIRCTLHCTYTHELFEGRDGSTLVFGTEHIPALCSSANKVQHDDSWTSMLPTKAVATWWKGEPFFLRQAKENIIFFPLRKRITEKSETVRAQPQQRPSCPSILDLTSFKRNTGSKKK